LPQCGQGDQVESQPITFTALNEMAPRLANPPEGVEVSTKRSRLVDEMPSEELVALTRRLAPPAAKKGAPMRAIHPDHSVLALSLIAPIFLYGIFTSQPSGLLVVLPLLAGFYAFISAAQGTDRQIPCHQDAQKAAEQRIHKDPADAGITAPEMCGCSSPAPRSLPPTSYPLLFRTS
jgi:hypothetical protein